MDIDESRVAELFKLDLNALLEVIAEEDGALYATPIDKIRIGLRLARNSIARIKNKICSTEFLEEYCGDGKTQLRFITVSAIADFLGGGGAVTVAVLVVQVGIENICNDSWEAKLE